MQNTDLEQISKTKLTNTQYVPPMIHGVSASQVFLPEQNIPVATIFDYLCRHFPHIAPDEWQQRFQDQLILDQQGQAFTLDCPYQANTHLYYYRFLANEIHVPFYEKILFENDEFMVVDKPHFLTMSPTGQYVQETLLVRLKHTTNNPNLSPIHRLDRETAGIVLFSKRPETRGLYQQLFANRQVQKTYHAIAAYQADLILPQLLQLKMEKGQPFYTMQIVEGEPNSQTHIELLQHQENWAKYCLKPITGKQHQLRVHLNYLNIPIKNDSLYPVIQRKAASDFTTPLQLLAKEITFIDPLLKQKMHFCSQFELTL